MKSTPIELIFTFRKKISLQTLLFLLLIAAIITAGFLLYQKAGTLRYAVLAGCYLLSTFGFRLYQRKRHLLKFLEPHNPDKTRAAFEAFLTQRETMYSAMTTMRHIIGVALMISMVLLIYFKPADQVTGVVCVTWIAFILGAMVQKWMMMSDSMMLQDLKHCLRNYPSEIS